MTMSLMSWLLPLAILTALLLDRLLGEPPSWAHPVVGMGQYLGLFTERLARLAPAAAFTAGALVWLIGALLLGALAAALETLLIQTIQPWSGWPGLLLCAWLMGLLLKPLLAWRMLSDEVGAVEAALAESLPAGRAQLSRLVSRDTSDLSAAEVREAAVETLAENLNDSVVAPLFWFMLAGLPGAAVYRFANTADAMWGYRDRREWSGKWAARADDALSWIPARITGWLMLGWQWRLGTRLRREAGLTPSPNSGWPMAAMALRLNLRLAKPGVYTLNAGGLDVATGDIARAQTLAGQTMLASTTLLALGAAVLRGAF